MAPQTLAQRTAHVRRSLRALGRRRRALDRAEKKWKKDAKEAVAKAEGLVQKTDMAEDLSVHRTTVYELRG